VSSDECLEGFRALTTMLAQHREQVRLMQEEITFLRNRMTTYLGDGIALTYLVDETPMLVRSNDSGIALNLIDGGIYEEDNLTVLLSFVRDDTVFLDIGANLGYFSLQIAQRIKNVGKVHAFEPVPELHELFRRNVFLNGLRHAVELHPFGLSDRNETVQFSVRRGDLGSGTIGAAPSPEFQSLSARVRRLDDVFSEDFTCDLVKIDVEGHEFQVLNGMRQIIDRSPHIKILFECFGIGDPADKGRIERLLGDLGFDLYVVSANATLRKLAPRELAASVDEWYILAIRPSDADGIEQRTKFAVFPRQLSFPSGVARELTAERVTLRGVPGQVIFYGPYWFLRKGAWRLRICGEIIGGLLIRVATRFGYSITEVRLAQGENETVFVVPIDVTRLEFIGVAASNDTRITVERIELIRES
jgi:FkbM family methyltransferase